MPEVSQFEFQRWVRKSGPSYVPVRFLKEELAAALQGKQLRLIQAIASMAALKPHHLKGR